MAALKAATGKTPTIQCNGKGSAYLHELWYQCVFHQHAIFDESLFADTHLLYSFETKGSVIDGLFLHAEPDGSKGSCADSVYYWPKGVPTPTPTPTPTSTATSGAPTPTSTEDKGTLQVFTAAGANVGCVLSKGTWSQQTCATFRPLAGVAPGTITFNHTKGPCAVDATNGTLACGPAVTVGSDFTNVSCNGPVRREAFTHERRRARLPRARSLRSMEVRHSRRTFCPLERCRAPSGLGESTLRRSLSYMYDHDVDDTCLPVLGHIMRLESSLLSSPRWPTSFP